MRFMNDYDIERAIQNHRGHPVLGPATLTLRNLRDVADANSDGWCHWPKPARSAAKLMELIEGDGTWGAYKRQQDAVTAAEVRKAYRPIRAMLTRHKLQCEIVEPQ